MKVVVRCENCVGYGTLEREHPMPLLTRAGDIFYSYHLICHECEGTGEVEYRETYDNLYEAEQDYKDCNIIRIEDK